MTISNTVANVEKGCVKFIGFFSPYAIESEDVSTLFLGADSKLYFPNAAMTIGSCRARFSLIGLNAGEVSGVRCIELNFGDEETGISSTTDASPNGRRLYDLQGRQLRDGAKKGLHIANGRIVFTK